MSLLNVCIFVLGVLGMVGVVMFGWLRECDFQVGQGGVEGSSPVAVLVIRGKHGVDADDERYGAVLSGFLSPIL